MDGNVCECFACMHVCLLGVAGVLTSSDAFHSIEKAFCGSPESAGPWRKWGLWHELRPQ